MKRLILLLLYIPFGAVQLRAQNPNAAKFPAALVTDAEIGVAKNRARALLTGNINDSTLMINVDNGAAFASPSWGSIGQEYIKICSIAGNVITVCASGRGAFGSAASSHNTGDAITGPLLDQHVNQLAAEVKAIETALGTSLQYVVQTGGSYSDPSWLTITKGKVDLGNVENTTLSTWAGSSNITTVGTLDSLSVSGAATFTSYVRAPKQINFTLYDPNVAIPAATIGGIWRAEYGGITATSVSCSADTADAVVQLTGVVLTSNLTCSNAGWATTTSFSTATLAQGSSIGFQIVSGTAQKINVSIQYTQQ